MIKLSNLRIAREDKSDIWCYCPFHNDQKTPNLLVSKSGQYAGMFKCFACGAFGKVDMEGKHKNVIVKKPNPINWVALNKLYESNYRTRVAPFNRWDVSDNTLYRMRIGWTGEAHSFPTFDAKKEMVGIQRIFPDNNKKMINGSRVGIIIPLYTNFRYAVCKGQLSNYFVITEGISDTAMAVELGWNVIGRLSCNSCEDIITNLLVVNSKKDVTIIIVPDSDKPGTEGAIKLATRLIKILKYVRILEPCEGKDLRDFVELKGKDYVKKWIKEEM